METGGTCFHTSIPHTSTLSPLRVIDDSADFDDATAFEAGAGFGDLHGLGFVIGFDQEVAADHLFGLCVWTVRYLKARAAALDDFAARFQLVAAQQTVLFPQAARPRHVLLNHRLHLLRRPLYFLIAPNQ